MVDVPETMQALVQLHEGYSPTATGPYIDSLEPYLEAREIPVPKPAQGQVLIKLRAASVNPSDIHFIKGEYGQPRVLDAPAGFEGCGNVVAAGEGAEALIGQRVAFVATASGAWADYAMTDAITCIPLRPDVSDEDGAAQIVNPLTAMAMVEIAAEHGDSFLASAATSQLGKLMIAAGRDRGLKPIGIVRRKETVAPLKDLGAEAVLVTSSAEFASAAASTIRALKPRVFLDAVGDQIAADIFAMMPNRGRWVSYGKLSSEPPKLTQMGQFIFMDKVIEGFWLTKWMRTTPPQTQMKVVQEVQARFADGRWKTDVSARVPLSEAMEKLPTALKKTDGKVMIIAG